MTAEPKMVAELQMEIQRLRVVHMVLREVESSVFDPNTYKEMNLLNRMFTGRDLETEADKKDSAEKEAAASDKLQKLGADAGQAQRIARVLNSVMGVGVDNGEGTETPSGGDADNDRKVRRSRLH